MSEAKYKVGDEVQYDGCKDVAEVVAVRVAGYVYDLKWRPGNVIQGYRECSLVPYVRPLAVGDRVRTCASGCQGVIIATHKNEFWVDRGDRYGCVTYHADELERIPNEEAGK